MGEFDKRHDFDSEELNILYERHPFIKFQNIVESWIVPIDQMLCSMRYDNPISEVRQINGRLIVLFKEDINRNKIDLYNKIIQICDIAIFNIDRDLNQIKDKKVPQCLN